MRPGPGAASRRGVIDNYTQWRTKQRGRLLGSGGRDSALFFLNKPRRVVLIVTLGVWSAHDL